MGHQLSAVSDSVGPRLQALDANDGAPLPSSMTGVHVAGEDPLRALVIATVLWCRHRRWHDGVARYDDLTDWGARVPAQRVAEILGVHRARVARVVRELLKDGVLVRDELGLDVPEDEQRKRRAHGVVFRWDEDLVGHTPAMALVVAWARNELNERTALCVPRIAHLLGLPERTVRSALDSARRHGLIGRLLSRNRWWIVTSEAERRRAEAQRHQLAARRTSKADVALASGGVAFASGDVALASPNVVPASPSSGVSGVSGETGSSPSRSITSTDDPSLKGQTALRADDPIPAPIRRGPAPNRIPTILDVAKAEKAGQRRLRDWGSYRVALQEAAATAHHAGAETTTMLAVLAMMGVLVAPAHWNAAGQERLRRARTQLAEQLVRQGVHASQLVEQALRLADRTRSSSPSAVAAQLVRSLGVKDHNDAAARMPMGAAADGLRLADPHARLAYWALLSEDERRDVEQWLDELDAIIAPVVAHVATASTFATKATQQAVRDQTRQHAVLRELEEARARNDAPAVADLVQRAYRLGCAVEDIKHSARVG
jgi:hypothetical protein